MTSPHVSVILPSYNSAHFLPRTIESVLQQEFEDYELLILDNASTDATQDIVAQYADPRIRTVRHPENIGMVGNINYGIDDARGDLGVILCADDHWSPDFLSRSIASQRMRPGLTFTNSMVRQDGRETVFRNVFHGLHVIHPWHLARHLHGIPLSSLMFPLGVHRERFDDRLPFNCDLEFALRQMIRRSLTLTFIDWPGVHVNLHEHNETRRYDIRQENLKLLKIVSRYTPPGWLRTILALQRMRLRHV
jgi:glycosyltransferase involved in cell wall biosynthesis